METMILNFFAPVILGVSIFFAIILIGGSIFIQAVHFLFGIGRDNDESRNSLSDDL